MTTSTPPAGEPVLEWFARRTENVRASERAFDDGTLEYRRLFSEVWGTFLLVLVAAGGGVIGSQPYGSDLTLAMKALAPGMMVMGVIFFMGTISGAHLNPAVTLAFAVRGNFPWRRVPGYIVAEVVGALLAAAFLQVVFGNIIAGATEPGTGVTGLQAVITEAVLTLGLVSVILGTAAGARNVGHRRSHRGRCLHRAGVRVGRTCQRCLHEPCPLASRRWPSAATSPTIGSTWWDPSSGR